METSFKTCLFGGFDREDVISFIEKTAAETQERLDALTTEREELLAKKRSTEAENAALRVQLNELTERLDNETALHTRVQSMEEELTALRRENETLREPAAQYQSLRDHIAEIEISAHRRTEEFRGKAIAELMQLIEQQRQWCAQQRDAYARMTEGVLQELRQAERQVEACDIGNFDRMEESLRQLENTLHIPE